MEPLLTSEPPEISTPVDRPEPPVRRLESIRRVLRGISSLAEWLIGVGSLLVGLSVVSSLPIVQFLSLGYLLEASGRVASTGRLRDGWIGVRLASRVGGIVVGAWLSMVPVWLVSSLATSAELIDPDGPIARGWRAGLLILSGLTLVQIGAACARGGRLRHFAWPPGNLIWIIRRLRRGGLYTESRDATWDFVEALHLPRYLKLGALGFAGPVIWLALPVSMLAMGQRVPVVGVLGALAMGIVVPFLPFLQVRLAIEGRFAAMFEVKAVRERFRRAPWAFGLAFALTVVAAVPLYLLKIEIVPREAAWLPGLLFVGFLFPARLACGWAYGRGGLRESRRHWVSRGIGRLGMLPVAAVYVLIVFLAQYISWGGSGSLYEQHAFLLPAPFLGFAGW